MTWRAGRCRACVAIAGWALSSCAAACSAAEAPVTFPADAAQDAPIHDGGRVDATRRDAAGDARDGFVDVGVPPPSLTRLAVSRAASADGGQPPVLLTPGFSPEVHDYYVRCAPGANALVVSMRAAPLAESLLVQPLVTPSLPEQTVTLAVNENEAVVAAASNAAGTAEYWVRCLPHDFPQLAFQLHPDAGVPSPGYYLVGNYTVLAGEAGYAMVLDSRGVPVWYYRQPDGYGVVNVDTDPSGAIHFIPAVSPYPYETHSVSPLATSYEIDSDEHELRVRSNNNRLLIGSPLVRGVDLTGLKVGLPDGGSTAMGPASTMRTCDLGEVDPGGTIVWHWTGLDHLDPVKDAVFVAWTGQTVDGGLVVDTFHCNSIDEDPSTGNLLVGSRDMNTVFFVEKATGRILWKMGGAPFTKDGALFIPVDDPFKRQHDARVVSWTAACGGGGTGQISMFDDETLISGNPGRAVIYDVVAAPADAGSDCGDGTARVSGAHVHWQYQGSVASIIMGSFRTLADGSRVVGWGQRESQAVTFTEIGPDGRDLLDFTFDPPAGNPSYRAIKTSLGAFDLETLRHTCGLATGNPTPAGGSGGFGGTF